MRSIRGLFFIATICLGLPGCSSTKQDDALLAELANLDKESIYERGEALYQEEEYNEARRYYSFVYDTFPNDPLGHQAALRIADTYAMKKDSMSRTEARLRYKDFVNRYPNDPDRDYALLKLGEMHTPRRLHPDRDLSPIHEALAAYQQLINLYPSSEHYEEAKNRLTELRHVLAEHEWQVARFFARNKRWQGVLWRLEYLKENYPDYPEMDKVDELMTTVQTIFDERMEEFERLKKEAEESQELAAESQGD
jgi:outer membrane protein assembly factor BamD